MLAARVEPKNGTQESKKTGNFKPLSLSEFQTAVDIDPTSQEALDLFLPRLAALSVLLVVTHRSEEPAVRWAEQRHIEKIHLDPFERREVEELVNQVTLGRGLPAEVLERIVSHADGVPPATLTLS
jgi:hypothetical protein